MGLFWAAFKVCDSFRQHNTPVECYWFWPWGVYLKLFPIQTFSTWIVLLKNIINASIRLKCVYMLNSSIKYQREVKSDFVFLLKIIQGMWFKLHGGYNYSTSKSCQGLNSQSLANIWLHLNHRLLRIWWRREQRALECMVLF